MNENNDVPEKGLTIIPTDVKLVIDIDNGVVLKMFRRSAGKTVYENLQNNDEILKIMFNKYDDILVKRKK